jgi:hypothetical protein
VVSVSSLWADEKIYWPVSFEPYTPAHPFEGGKEDPAFRTKLKTATQLVEQEVEEEIRFVRWWPTRSTVRMRVSNRL